MQVAYYQENVISLSTFEREKWQQLYNASIRQQVTCIHCQSPMRFQISICEPPTFIHTRATEECIHTAKVMETKLSNKLNEAEIEINNINGFNLPVKKTITDSQSEHEGHWKEPENARALPTFNKTHSSTHSWTGYRQTLADSGILLDDAQWSAVTTTEGPLLILAGAGSGKTRVLTTRTAYMLTELHYAPKEFILVTFTAKAAKEMKERMAIYPGIDASILRQLMIGTFHSIFYKILLHHDPQTWAPSSLLKMDWQRQAMIKEAGREITLDEKEFAFDQALTQISWWKNHLLSPEQVEATSPWEEKVSYLYKRYEEMRKSKGMFDFDDMLLGVYDLFLEQPQILQRYQKRFSYVSVDEFQDTNKVQYELLTMLTKSKNICVVGDDDQSIYAFRGSDPTYILNFNRAYPNAKTVILDQNYRSNHEIVSVANNVIATNRTRFQKELVAQRSTTNVPFLFFPYDEEEEATMIVTDMKQKIEKGSKPSDFAILFRTNTSARALVERLIESTLPFQLEIDGESFYRRKAVRKVLSYMKLSINPDDTEAIKELIGALFLKQQVVQEVKALSIINDCTLVEALPLIQGLQPFQLKKLQSLPGKFKELIKQSPLDAINFIEQEMGFADYVKKQGNEGNKMERGSDDVRDLKVVANLHETIVGFLDYINHMIAKYDEHRTQKTTDEAIQLLTIHRSKGLEYNHVYIVGAVEGGLPHDYALDAWREGNDKPLEEERRLMYVAMTRAIDTLAISIPSRRKGKKAIRSRFARELNRLAASTKSTVRG
ncbi:ATP-dependent helicase [Bacillus suaedae]|uniref:DNA 3'-5' helicase n=1 Tax=Halalkalibacter suaedae TaxID=2822140 RepID=A0A941ASM7_9BACI|nr:ATP-dependent helicase [Bacillus suaedae]MBP3949499.1 ATP-dependent helicase [Bacillus suaedae]